MDKQYAKKMGIHGIAVSMVLCTLDFPLAFPIDTMHLLPGNINVPRKMSFYRGTFF